MMKFHSKIILLVVSIFILSSCHTINFNNSPPAPLEKEFKKKLIHTGDFVITTYQKIQRPDEPIVFYIEGDGAAFHGKYRISANPTPRQQLVSELAASDKRDNIVYVARPCQYTPMEYNPKCEKAYWSTKRMSQEVVNSLITVIDVVKNDKKYHLVGFSGGGGIAVLIAAHRTNDVESITTISGNLDHKSFTRHHDVTPMIGCLNPIDYASSINFIPQLHLSGSKDKVVPPFIADKYVRSSRNANCVSHKIIPGVSHNSDDWKKAWNLIHTVKLECFTSD